MIFTNVLQPLLDLKYINLLRPRNRIYLLSHMRANTSLLGHIVGSSPEIEGYYELHRSYRNRMEALLNKKRYYYRHKPKHGATYIFDKLLHNNLSLNSSVVTSQDRIIFMIREPSATIASVVSIFGDKPGHKWSTLSGAEAYYIDRLRHLQWLSHEFKDRYYFIKAEDLVTEPDTVLSSLSSYLRLQRPLSKHYQTFNKTGQRGAGDSSDNIKSGTVISDAPKPYQPYNITPEVDQLYRDTLDLLRTNAEEYYPKEREGLKIST